MGTTPEITSASTSGWIITMPGGHPSMWYQNGWKGCASSDDALRLFEPDAAKRDELTRQGWSARSGAATEFYTLAHPERISA